MFGFLPGPVACCAKAAATYRAHFCGLCNTLRQDYGLWARWLINRDCTFLALLGTAQTKDSPRPTLATCCNPWAAPRRLVQDSHAVRYAAAVTLCGLAAKLEDDAEDERGPRRWLAMAGRRACEESTSRAVGLLHALDFPVGRVMQALHATPCGAHGGSGLHEAAAPTSLAYGEIVAHTGVLAGVSQAVLPALREIGTQLGFLIYAKDAWDDWEQDHRRRRFNPLHRFARSDQRREALIPPVRDAMASMRAALDRVPLSRNRDMLYDILVTGTEAAADRWLQIREDAPGSREEVEAEKQKKADQRRKKRRCCDGCDSGCHGCDCSDCCQCVRCPTRGCGSRAGGGEMCDCNPCDGDGCDCCGCDCG